MVRIDPPSARADRDERTRWASRVQVRAMADAPGALAAARRFLLYGRSATQRGAWLSRLHVALAAAITWRYVRRTGQR